MYSPRKDPNYLCLMYKETFYKIKEVYYNLISC